MAFVWVQVWAPPQAVNAVIMGDIPSGSQNTGRPSNVSHPTRQDMSQDSAMYPYVDGEGRSGQPGNHAQSNYASNQLASHQIIPTRTGSFDMNQLGASLPEIPQHQNFNLQQQPRYPPTYSPGHVYQPQHASQFLNVQAMNSPGNVAYNIPYQDQYQGAYVPSHTPSPTHPHAGSNSANQFYQNQLYMAQQQQLHQQQHHLQTSQYYTHSGQYSPQNQMYPGLPPTGHSGPRNNNFPMDSRQQVPQQSYGYLGSGSAGVVPAKPNKSECHIISVQWRNLCVSLR